MKPLLFFHHKQCKDEVIFNYDIFPIYFTTEYNRNGSSSQSNLPICVESDQKNIQITNLYENSRIKDLKIELQNLEKIDYAS